jgi:hypothetical protein
MLQTAQWIEQQERIRTSVNTSKPDFRAH